MKIQHCKSYSCQNVKLKLCNLLHFKVDAEQSTPLALNGD